jgi:hypothetical protein
MVRKAVLAGTEVMAYRVALVFTKFWSGWLEPPKWPHLEGWSQPSLVGLGARDLFFRSPPRPVAELPVPAPALLEEPGPLLPLRAQLCQGGHSRIGTARPG